VPISIVATLIFNGVTHTAVTFSNMPAGTVPGDTLTLTLQDTTLDQCPPRPGRTAGEVDKRHLPDRVPLWDSFRGERTFSDTAALLENLVLLISVDSSPVHLAGALGAPVWGLIARLADWRWLLGRDDSPWSPTLRLFRQRHLGDWAEDLRRVAKALRHHIQGHQHRMAG
jgi:hypothetical protein